MFRMQYQDVRVRIGAHVTVNRKKCVKKVPKDAKSQLLGLEACLKLVVDLQTVKLVRGGAPGQPIPKKISKLRFF